MSLKLSPALSLSALLVAGLLLERARRRAREDQVQGHRPAAGHGAHPEEQGTAVLRDARGQDGAAHRDRIQADRHARHQGHRATARHEGGAVRDGLAAHVAELPRRAHHPRPRPRRPEPRLQDRARGGECLHRHPRCPAAKAVRREAPRRVAVRAAGPVLQEAHRQPGRRQGPEGAHLRPEPREIHRVARRHAGADRLCRDAPVLVAGRGRLRHHRAQFGQLRRLARGHHPLPADRHADRPERLWRLARCVEETQARPAGQAEGGVRCPDRGHLEVFRRTVHRCVELQRRQGTVHDGQEIQPWSTCRSARRTWRS